MPLTPDLIARTTLALGDRDGAAAMSMRRIAAELGCDPMAIYRHFPNRERCWTRSPTSPSPASPTRTRPRRGTGGYTRC